ncbi:MAG: ABC transporter, partial [Gammaproteobacteria bacterium]|nr:ABC transporter [Gammaproteobacteria bacterium]
LEFVLNAVDWLAQDEDLIAIRAKERTPPPLVFESEALQELVKWANVAGVPLVLIVLAALHLWRR